MDIKEIKQKNHEELKKFLLEKRKILQELRFKDANKQLKDVREIRKIRKTISRILTVLNNKK